MALSPKQEAFCLAYIHPDNKSAVEAYQAVYNVRDGTKPESVYQSASRVMANVNVASRIEELKAPVVEKAQITLENHLKRLGELGIKADNKNQFNAAITAEVHRGKASGLYVDKIEMSVNAGLGDLLTAALNNVAARKNTP